MEGESKNNMQVFEYFKTGFQLANKSYRVFLFAFILSLLDSIMNIFGESSLKIILQITGLVLSFILIGYQFSLPVFLFSKQQGKGINLNTLLLTSLHNTKRLLLPFIALFVTAIIIFVIILFSVLYFSGGDIKSLQFPVLGFSIWEIIIAVLMVPSSFLVFTPIYFSLEKKGLLSSFKQSIGLSFKNLKFIAVVAIVTLSVYLLTKALLNDYQSIYELVIRSAVWEYETLLIAAAALIFYQKKIKKGV